MQASYGWARSWGIVVGLLTGFCAPAAPGIPPDRDLTTIAAPIVPGLASVAFLTGSQTVQEDAGVVTLHLVRVGPSTNDVSVILQLLSESATAGSDFAIPSELLFELPAGVDTVPVSIPIINDLLPEESETFTVKILLVVGADLGSPPDVKVTVVDEDSALPPPVIEFATGSAELLEAAGPGLVTLVRTGNLAATSSVWITISPGPDPSATPGDDLPASPIAVSFQPGQSAAVAPIPILDDPEFEPDEWVSLALATPVNAVLGPVQTALLQVRNDDPKPRASLFLTKSVKPTELEIGNPAEFTLTVENVLGDAAKGVEITDTLPAGLILDPKTLPAEAKLTGNQLVWSLKQVDVGAAFKQTLQFKVEARVPGTFTNTASVTKSATDGPIGAATQVEARVVFIGHALCGQVILCNFLGQPLTNATVTLRDAMGRKLAEMKSGAAGAFCFTNLPAGAYQVLVDPPDPKAGIQAAKEDVTLPLAITPLPILLEWKVLKGRLIVLPGGLPLKGATVKADDGKNPVTTKSDDEGRYLFTNLPEGDYKVTVTPPIGGLKSRPLEAKVTVGGISCPATADFELYGDLAINGRLAACNPTGGSIPYGTVQLAHDTLGVIQTLRAGSDGTFVFKNLPAGEYTLTATHPTFSFNPASTVITLKTAGRSVTLVGTDGNTLGGRVLGANRNPLGDRAVQLFGPLPPNGARPAAALATTRTDADGSFVFPRLAEGRYDVVAVPGEPALTFTPQFYRFAVGPRSGCASYGVFIGSQNAVELVALEVVQVTQDWQNSLPLVDSKAALIRAFLRPTGSNTQPVLVSGSRLQVSRDGKKLATLTAEKITARTDYQKRRNAKDASLAFLLPKTLATGALTATLEWPTGILTTAALPNQTAVVNNATTVRFLPTAPLPVKWVLVNWTFGGKTHKAPASLVGAHSQRLLAMLPTPEIRAAGAPDALDWEPATDPADESMTDKERYALWGSLQKLLMTKRNREDPGLGLFRTVYHGLLKDTVIAGHAGGIPGGTLFADIGKNPAGLGTPAHEWGHVLGRHHAVHTLFGLRRTDTDTNKVGLCAEPAALRAPDFPMAAVQLLDPDSTFPFAPVLGPMDAGDYRFAYGWDRGNTKYISPFSTADVMSYCLWGNGYSWPGVYTYTNFFNAIINRFGTGRAPAPTGPPPAQSGLQISGELDLETGTLVLDPVFPVRFATPDTAPEPGDYQLRLLDAGEVVLHAESFQVNTALNEGSPATPSTAYFSFVAPQPPGLAAVEILHEGRVLHRRVASANSPRLQLLAPLSNTPILGDSLEIRWLADDDDNDALRFLVEFSPDDGLTWSLLAHGLSGREFTVPLEQLRGTKLGRIRVIANDGIHNTVAEVGPLTLPDQAPQVTIELPIAGEEFSGDNTVILSARAWDFEEGPLNTEQITWSSDRDGVLGTGAELVLAAAQLSEGRHELTATATDSGGSSGRQSVVVQVYRQIPIPITLQRDGEEIILRWPLRGAAYYLQTAPVLESQAWSFVDAEPIETEDEVVVRIPSREDGDSFFRLIAP